MQAQQIFQAIDTVAPRELQESYDNTGLQCGDPHQEVSRVLTCLDVTEAVVEEAHALGCQLIVSHHPLLFRGTKCINPQSDYISRVLWLAIRYGIGLYASHTNLDKAVGGMNHRLADILGLTDVHPMSECGVYGQLPHAMTTTQLLEHIKTQLGGAPLKCNKEAMSCPQCNKEAMVTPQSVTSPEHSDPQPKTFTTLALCTGSGADFIDEAVALGVDAYLTGEMHYHSWFGHPTILIIEAGHYETEQHAPAVLNDIITAACPGIECITSAHNQSPCLYL